MLYECEPHLTLVRPGFLSLVGDTGLSNPGYIGLGQCESSLGQDYMVIGATPWSSQGRSRAWGFSRSVSRVKLICRVSMNEVRRRRALRKGSLPVGGVVVGQAERAVVCVLQWTSGTFALFARGHQFFCGFSPVLQEVGMKGCAVRRSTSAMSLIKQ